MNKATICLVLLALLVFATAAKQNRADHFLFQSRGDGQRSAIEVWPTRGTAPTEHAKAEFVVYRNSFSNGAFERMNWSGMNDNDPMYRFGVEKGVFGGEYRPIVFCFENIIVGQPAYCPFRIDPVQGVLVCNHAGFCQRIGG